MNNDGQQRQGNSILLPELNYWAPQAEKNYTNTFMWYLLVSVSMRLQR